MGDKQDNLNKLIEEISQGAKSWNELMEILDVSEATMSRYLKELREEDLVEKRLLNDEIVYAVHPSAYVENEKMFEELVQTAKRKNRLLDGLEQYGFFDQGMSSQDILNFLEEYFSEVNLMDREKLEDRDELDMRLYAEFNSVVSSVLSPTSGVSLDVSISADTEPEEHRTEIDQFRARFDDFNGK